MTMQASGQTNVRDNRTRKNRKESIATLLFTMEFGGFKKRREFVLSSMQKGSSFLKTHCELTVFHVMRNTSLHTEYQREDGVHSTSFGISYTSNARIFTTARDTASTNRMGLYVISLMRMILQDNRTLRGERSFHNNESISKHIE